MSPNAPMPVNQILIMLLLKQKRPWENKCESVVEDFLKDKTEP